MRMTRKRKAMRDAIDRFDHAALAWGWQMDQGSGARVAESRDEYQAAKAALEALAFA